MAGWRPPCSGTATTCSPRRRPEGSALLDEAQLTFAAAEQRILVTKNVKHYPQHHAAWMERGESHSGVIVLVGHQAIGTLLRRLQNLLAYYTNDDLKNHLIYLGAEFD